MTYYEARDGRGLPAALIEARREGDPGVVVGEELQLVINDLARRRKPC